MAARGQRGRAVQAPESDVDRLKRETEARQTRLACLKLAVEMRTGASNPSGVVKSAVAFVSYVLTGQEPEKG